MTRPIHDPRCGTHRSYHLTCAQFDDLLAWSRTSCRRCGKPARNPNGMGLFVDHDHSLGWRAVRGLVCQGCNAIAGAIERGVRAMDAATAAYMAAPWHELRGVTDFACPANCRRASHARALRWTPNPAR